MNLELDGIKIKMKRYHHYKTPDGRIYLACPQSCLMCIAWKKDGQRWKPFVFMPLHCHSCCAGGYENNFQLHRGFILCNQCHKKLLKRIKEIIYPHRMMIQHKTIEP